MYVTLEEAKDHIRVDFIDDDHYIEALIDVAEASIINEVTSEVPGLGTVATSSTALTGSGTEFLRWKAGDVVRVKGETDRTISTVTSDTALTVTSAFTNTTSSLSYSVTPTPLVGGALPKPLKQAILILVGQLYEQREAVNIGNIVNKLPYSIEFLIAPYKNWTVK